MHSNIACGLDIGSSSVRAVIIRMEPNFKEKILGVGEAPTRGFSKNVVTDLSLLTDAIENSLSKAERASACRVRSVTTNISGVHIRTFKSRGSIHISDSPTEIKESDIKRSIESGRLIAMSLDRVSVYIVAQRFFIDDKIEITEPLGLFGAKLDVDLNIVTALASILQNLTKAVNMAGYEVEDVVVSGSGSALSVFEESQLREGALLIDIGKELCEATLFMDGKFWDCFYFPFGGDDLSQLLQENLKITFPEAEELRIRYASCEDVTREKLVNILFPKIKIVFEDVYKTLESFLKGKKGLSNISVVGGLSRMDGLIETVEEIFGVPVNLGRIVGIKDSTSLEHSFLTSLGLARYSAKKKEKERQMFLGDAGNPFSRAVSKIRTVFKEYF